MTHILSVEPRRSFMGSRALTPARMAERHAWLGEPVTKCDPRPGEPLTADSGKHSRSGRLQNLSKLRGSLN